MALLFQDLRYLKYRLVNIRTANILCAADGGLGVFLGMNHYLSTEVN